MAPLFEILDNQTTPLGNLVLRRRESPSSPEALVYEVTINSEMLMSSSVNVSERALAYLALEGNGQRPRDVLIGGLGLGYTAAAALEYEQVGRVDVVELLEPVIDWHQRRLVPLADMLLNDDRCSFIAADFFEYAKPENAPRSYDAILLDIDHAPDCLLHERHGDFYTPSALRDAASCLRPGGVFALWSAWEPTMDAMAALWSVFRSVKSHEVDFFNPHADEEDSNWIMVCKDVIQ